MIFFVFAPFFRIFYCEKKYPFLKILKKDVWKFTIGNGSSSGFGNGSTFGNGSLSSGFGNGSTFGNQGSFTFPNLPTFDITNSKFPYQRFAKIYNEWPSAQKPFPEDVKSLDAIETYLFAASLLSHMPPTRMDTLQMFLGNTL